MLTTAMRNDVRRGVFGEGTIGETISDAEDDSRGCGEPGRHSRLSA
jgi:hypothetical protein